MTKQLTPLVSIVVPVYNVERYLEECFSSIASQTYRNIEIILVDDGSKDKSGEIADVLAQSDSRAMVIHKKNSGPSDTRNLGIKIAKGEYLVFIDSDDYIDTNFIEILLNSALQTQSDIVQCNNSRDRHKLGQGDLSNTSKPGIAAFIELLSYKMISPVVWGKIYKTSLFRDNNLDFPTGRQHEDTAILYKLIYFANNVVCLNKILYYYRPNDNSIMTGIVNSSYRVDHYSSVVKYHQELDDFIKQNEIVVSKMCINRHKALRLLSVLNKLALHKYEKTDTYGKFRKEYYKLSLTSLDLICLLGFLPVALPVVFRTGRSITPSIRTLLGKV